MELVKIAGEHTVDVSLLPEEPLVLDVGCRGFVWDRELLKLRPKARILAFDADPIVHKPDDLSVEFVNAAVTHWAQPMLTWTGTGDAGYIERNAIEDPGFGWRPNGVRWMVDNHTVNNLAWAVASGRERPNFWVFDLVKLDCEGSEFGILENWPKHVAKQISVEFHDFFNRNKWNDEYFNKLFSGPLKDYRVVQHELQPIGPGSMGHWDSLLILKDLK